MVAFVTTVVLTLICVFSLFFMGALLVPGHLLTVLVTLTSLRCLFSGQLFGFSCFS